MALLTNSVSRAGGEIKAERDRGWGERETGHPEVITNHKTI